MKFHIILPYKNENKIIKVMKPHYIFSSSCLWNFYSMLKIRNTKSIKIKAEVYYIFKFFNIKTPFL